MSRGDEPKESKLGRLVLRQRHTTGEPVSPHQCVWDCHTFAQSPLKHAPTPWAHSSRQSVHRCSSSSSFSSSFTVQRDATRAHGTPASKRCMSHSSYSAPPEDLPISDQPTSASLRLRSANCSVILGFSARYFSISSFRRFSRCSCERQQGGEVIHAEVSTCIRDL